MGEVCIAAARFEEDIELMRDGIYNGSNVDDMEEG